MPVEEVTCGICGNRVSKRKTLLDPKTNKRVCRVHEGVVAASQQKQQAELQRSLDNEKAKQDYERLRYKKTEKFDTDHRRCWACRVEGIMEEEYAQRMLIAMEKVKLKYGLLNPFDPDTIKKMSEEYHTPNGDLRHSHILFRCKMEADNPLLKHAPHEIVTMVQLGGMVLLCQDCTKRLKIEPVSASLKVTLETLSILGSVYQKTVQPVVEAVADQELRQQVRKDIVAGNIPKGN